MNKPKLIMEELLKDILEVQSTSFGQEDMQRFILERYPEAISDEAGNIYITKGDADNYPCVVAHLDTVHKLIAPDEYHVVEVDGRVFAMNTTTMDFTGVGGDDKCGIYIALYCLEYFKNIKVAFFVDEEMGCLGSAKADMTFFEDTSYVIQGDRQGYQDVVTTIMGVEMTSRAFNESIAPYVEGYSKDFCVRGGMTDVYQLKLNDLKVSCINLSCGYYRPHMPNEFILLEDLYDTRDFAVSVINALGDIPYPHTYIPKTYSHPSQHTYKKYGGGGETIEAEVISKECTVCGSNNIDSDEFLELDYCYSCEEYFKQN